MEFGLRQRKLTKKFAVVPATMVLMLAASLLLSCGGGSANDEALTIVPATFNITVNAQTGTVTGATPIQVFLNKTPVDLNTLTFTSSSTTVPSACIGIDQAGVPHCNTGCGTTFSGTITATLTSSDLASPTTATTIVNCQFQ
jgi:hypothetical protein